MPIDYSKWDNIDCSDSSDNDEHDHHHHHNETSSARVTRLDAPSRITFGGTQSNNDGVPTVHVSHEETADLSTATRSVSQSEVPREGSSVTKVRSLPGLPDNPLKEWSRRGGNLVTHDNDQDPRHLFWSQDRYSVQLRLELKDDESIHRITVDGILPFSDRHCATGTTHHTLSIICEYGKKGSTSTTNRTVSTNVTTKTILSGDLPHPVHWAQDDDADALTLDWTVEKHPTNPNQRFVLLTLHKAVPMQGLFVWWKRPLMNFEEQVDDEMDDTEEDRVASKSSNDFLQAWEEAHQIFKETKRPPPQVLPSP